MTIAQLLAALFNLDAQTDFWNSGAAARDFWLVFAVVLTALVAYPAVRAKNHRLRHH
jgi:hypothetical protein